MDLEQDTTLQLGKLLSVSGDPHGDEFRYEVRAGRIVHAVHGILTNFPVIMERSQINGDRQSVITIEPHAVTSVRDGLERWLRLSDSRKLGRCFRGLGDSHHEPFVKRPLRKL